jgi:hypothetical protein
VRKELTSFKLDGRLDQVGEGRRKQNSALKDVVVTISRAGRMAKSPYYGSFSIDSLMSITSGKESSSFKSGFLKLFWGRYWKPKCCGARRNPRISTATEDMDDRTSAHIEQGYRRRTEHSLHPDTSGMSRSTPPRIAVFGYSEMSIVASESMSREMKW